MLDKAMHAVICTEVGSGFLALPRYFEDYLSNIELGVRNPNLGS